MVQHLIEQLLDPQFLVMVFAAIAAGATVIDAGDAVPGNAIRCPNA